jgi:LacI family transcriptional regulator
MPRKTTTQGHRVKLKDVAQAAGVSISTVSEVLNGRPGGWVSAKTHERVKRVAKSLNYSPNHLARSLRRRVTSTLGLLFPGMVNDYAVTLVEAIYEEAEVRGYSVLLKPQRNEDAGEQARTVEDLMSHMVDGLLVFSPYQRWRAVDTLTRLPTVLVDTQLERTVRARFPSVVIDRKAGIEQAVLHLLRSNRRRICMIVDLSDADHARARTGPEKLAGWRSAHRIAGVKASEELVVVVELRDAWSVDQGEAVGLKLLARGLEFDAVVCNNDQLAIGVMNTLIAAGKRVPQDVAVIGYGDQPACRIAQVRLASVAVPVQATAIAAVQLMIALLSRNGQHAAAETGDQTDWDRVVPTAFVPRPSGG